MDHWTKMLLSSKNNEEYQFSFVRFRYKDDKYVCMRGTTCQSVYGLGQGPEMVVSN